MDESAPEVGRPTTMSMRDSDCYPLPSRMAARGVESVLQVCPLLGEQPKGPVPSANWWHGNAVDVEMGDEFHDGPDSRLLIRRYSAHEYLAFPASDVANPLPSSCSSTVGATINSSAPRSLPSSRISHRSVDNPFSVSGVPCMPPDWGERGFKAGEARHARPQRRAHSDLVGESGIVTLRPFNLGPQTDAEGRDGAYFAIPADVEGNEVVNVMMPSSKLYRVPIPLEAVPGDFLHITPKAVSQEWEEEAGNDGAVAVMHIPGGTLQLKSLRIIVAGVSFISAIVMGVALLLPFWLDITVNDKIQSLGLWGRHCRGYIRSYTLLDMRCALLHEHEQDEVPEEVIQRILIDMNMRGFCQLFHHFRIFGLQVCGVEVFLLLLQVAAATGLLLHHSRLARFGTLISVAGQAVVLAYYFYTMQALLQTLDENIVVAMGYSVYCCIVALLLGASSLLMMVQVSMELNNKSMCLGCLVPEFKRRPHKKQAYSWDEDNPGEGCPILWRTYGLTRSNLLRNHRGGLRGWLCVIVTMVLSIPAHFAKTFDWNGVRRKHFGPPSEEDVIRATGVRSRVVINYMMYRRSNGIMAVVAFVPVLVYHVWRFIEKFMEIVENGKEDMPLQTFAAFQASWRASESSNSSAFIANASAKNASDARNSSLSGPSFESFLIDLSTQAIKSITIQTSGLLLWKDASRIAFLCFGAVFTILGVYRWGNFKVSSRIFLIGWAALIGTPFALTMYPTRMFLDFTMVELIAQHAFHEARLYYQVDEAILSCLYADVPEKLTSALSSVESVCGVVESVPYVMPPSVNVGIVSIPIHTIPYIGSKLPEAGTDLSGLHAACSSALTLLRHNLTLETGRAVPDACIEAASFLYRNTPPGRRSAFHDIEHLVRDGFFAQDPSHVGSEWMLQLDRSKQGQSNSSVPLKSAVPRVIGIKQQEEVGERDIGRLVRCSLLASCMPTCDMRDATLVVRDFRELGTCSVTIVSEQLVKANANGLLLLYVQDLEHLPILPLWTACVKSRSDRRLLQMALKVDAESPLVAKVVRNRLPWEARQARTSYGCRCQGLGYDSMCKLRPHGPANRPFPSHLEEEPHFWCETVSNCPVPVDVCSPTGSMTVSSAKPSMPCLPEYPCRKQHEWDFHIQDRCAVKILPASWMGTETIVYADCVPPEGLSGHYWWKGKEGLGTETQEKGVSATIPLKLGMTRVSLRGIVLAEECCKYRVSVPNANSTSVSLQMSWLQSREFMIHLDAKAMEVLDVCEVDKGLRRRLMRQPQEIDMDVLFRARTWISEPGAARLEEQCERKEDKNKHGVWEVVPQTKLRFDPAAAPSDNSLSPYEEEDSTPVRQLATKWSGEQDIRHAVHDWNRTLAGEKTGDTRYHMLSSMCPDFVGTPCDFQKSCGERQVCDSKGDENYKPGHCRCADGHCYKDVDNGTYSCIPQGYVAKKLVVDLVEHVPAQELELLPKFVIGGKMLMSLILSGKEGVSNINGMVGHVLALGPGFLLAAWTAKIIFAHSVIPAYFIYFFPWMYVPFAWSIYGVYYQLLPDPILFLGLFGLSFWPIYVAADSVYHGLHHQMTVPEVMTVVNDMLLRYWACLFASYGLIIWFAVNFDLNNYVALDLKEKITFRDVMDYYLTNVFDPVPLAMGIVESFGIFFMTCISVCDMFIEMICKENNEAWSMIRRYMQITRGEGGEGTSHHAPVPRTQDDRFAVEMEVIQDWLHLIRDERLPREAAKLRKLMSRAVGRHGVPGSDTESGQLRQRQRATFGEVEMQMH